MCICKAFKLTQKTTSISKSNKLKFSSCHVVTIIQCKWKVYNKLPVYYIPLSFEPCVCLTRLAIVYSLRRWRTTLKVSRYYRLLAAASVFPPSLTQHVEHRTNWGVHYQRCNHNSRGGGWSGGNRQIPITTRWENIDRYDCVKNLNVSHIPPAPRACFTGCGQVRHTWDASSYGCPRYLVITFTLQRRRV